MQIWVSGVRAAAFTCHYEVLDGDRLAVTGSTLLVPYDFDIARPRRLTAEEKEFLARWTDEPGRLTGARGPGRARRSAAGRHRSVQPHPLGRQPLVVGVGEVVQRLPAVPGEGGPVHERQRGRAQVGQRAEGRRGAGGQAGGAEQVLGGQRRADDVLLGDAPGSRRRR